jgi:hypothetical protein
MQYLAGIWLIARILRIIKLNRKSTSGINANSYIVTRVNNSRKFVLLWSPIGRTKLNTIINDFELIIIFNLTV